MSISLNTVYKARFPPGNLNFARTNSHEWEQISTNVIAKFSRDSLLSGIYGHRIKISNRRATQRYNVSAFFYAKICSLLLYWPEGGAASQYSVFIGQKMSLTG
jgi:hypothetical protein